ncbi:unnamed protein product [Moneuplotes crassus]|uniref:L-type lectin-like domain-containing protein n=1 Tax=Euplotes crassus TaxID=5936 RepID=A0AAD1UHR1_EUPCR|nr:unnamed protein product [Moneuplotes crassus]
MGQKLQLFFLLCLVLANCQDQGTKILSHSFDFPKKEYPHLIHNTYGASIISKNFIKLVPAVPFRAGEVVTGVKSFIDDFRADIEFEIISSPTNNPYGFGIWYLNALKEVNDRKGSLFGLKGDFSGLGIFVFKNTNGGQWIVHGLFNRGMEEQYIDESKINENNACSILGSVENTVRTIRLEKSHKKVKVSIKDPSTGNYGECFSISNDGLAYKGYFGFSTDNFDEQHVNDINLYSLNVFNIGGQKVEKSLMNDQEINTDAKKGRDILHKYTADKDGVNRMKVDLRNRENQSGRSSSQNAQKGSKDGQNTGEAWQDWSGVSKASESSEIMVNFRHIQAKYQEHVNEFQKNIASIDANTAQIIEFNKQKAWNMSANYKAMERKGQELYQSRAGLQPQQNQNNNNEEADKLKDMIYNLDVKIAAIEKELAEFQSTGEMITTGLEEDHQNKVQITQKYIEKAFDPTVGDLVKPKSSFPISFTTLFFLIIIILACVFIFTHMKEWSMVTHILEKEKRKL